MTRVLATLLKWRRSADWTHEAHELATWIREIIDGTRRTDDDTETGLIRNYQDDESWWGEVAGTALLASVVYRMAVLVPAWVKEGELEWAERKRSAVGRCVDQETGIAGPTVNPRRHGQRERVWTGSPEAQGFLVLLEAAWRDWVVSEE